MSKGKILSKKEVFKSRHFHVDQVVIEREGKTFTKDIVTRAPFVLIVPYTKDNEIYLESQYRDAFEKELLEVVAGHIDPGEDPLVAAKRELQEETGLTAKSWKHVATWEISPNMRQTMDVFFATDLEEGTSALQDDEAIELVRVSLAEVMQSIASGKMIISFHIAALLLFDRLQKQGKL